MQVTLKYLFKNSSSGFQKEYIKFIYEVKKASLC